MEFGSNTPFRQQLEATAGTGLFVSVHTSSLANTPFLPPGAAVVELIPQLWGAGGGLDR